MFPPSFSRDCFHVWGNFYPNRALRERKQSMKNRKALLLLVVICFFHLTLLFWIQAVAEGLEGHLGCIQPGPWVFVWMQIRKQNRWDSEGFSGSSDPPAAAFLIIAKQCCWWQFLPFYVTNNQEVKDIPVEKMDYGFRNKSKSKGKYFNIQGIQKNWMLLNPPRSHGVKD